MDVEAIDGGVDFVKVLEDAVQSCDVVIALVGRQWLNIKNEWGERRLENVEDFVRIEIVAALNRDIRVIPILVDGMNMPRSTELPESLKPLARRNALQVSYNSFNADANRLISHLERALKAVETAKARGEQEAERKRAESRSQKSAEEERVRKVALEKARQGKVAREKKNAEEKARRDALKRVRLQERVEKTKRFFSEIAPSPIYIIGGIALLFLLGYVIKNIFAPIPSESTSAAVTESLATEIPSSSASSAPALIPTKVSTPIATSKSEGILDTDPVGNEIPMRLVPEGGFTVGSNEYNSEKPPHIVNLKDFYMDLYEVTNALYKACVDAGACTEPQSIDHYDNLAYANHPVVYVDWNQAKTYCEWRGADLPSESQWEKAARGIDERTYPWGEEIDCDRANYTPSCVGDTSEVGSYESGKSPYGLYDLAGNAWEWVDDWYAAYPGNTIASSYYGATYRVLRGGSWNFNVDFARVSIRYRYNPDSSSSNIGFRCFRSLP